MYTQYIYEAFGSFDFVQSILYPAKYMTTSDFYAVLGVLPDAEDIVIVAAYRALAHRYHPDRALGDPAELNLRMSAINAAFHVLGDKKRRADYDESRKSFKQTEMPDDEETDQREAFAEALKEIEERWLIALSIYPDLSVLRNRLQRVSASLSFSFVIVLLDTQAFRRRAELAQQLESNFMQRYFGTNREILNFASLLIAQGEREAALKLNRLVSVIGSDVESSLLIDKVNEEHRMHILHRGSSPSDFRHAGGARSATITCPDCGKQVGSWNEFCPSCLCGLSR